MVHSKIYEYSHFIDRGDHQLHLRRFYTKEGGIPCFLLHGSIENGTIFYSKSGKGLAPFLASAGYDVFTADLRGRGSSTPPLTKHDRYDQYQAITEEIPAFLQEIRAVKGSVPIHCLAHSWGGVLLLAYLARFEASDILSMVFFGTKRKIDVFNWDKLWRIDMLWDKIGWALSQWYGFLPAALYGFGSDNEPKQFYEQVKKWALGHDWIDPVDGFDYPTALLQKVLPPTLYLTGVRDSHLGHKNDVKRLMREVGNNPHDQFRLLGKVSGYAVDYDHINILTHPQAPEDHFPQVVQWLRQHERITEATT